MHKVLQNISMEQIVRMRMEMASVWQKLLWTRGRKLPSQRAKEAGGPPRGYLGESGANSAFSVLMEVLLLRLSRECNGTSLSAA
jgi:hypothetical protein